MRPRVPPPDARPPQTQVLPPCHLAFAPFTRSGEILLIFTRAPLRTGLLLLRPKEPYKAPVRWFDPKPGMPNHTEQLFLAFLVASSARGVRFMF